MSIHQYQTGKSFQCLVISRLVYDAMLDLILTQHVITTLVRRYIQVHTYINIFIHSRHINYVLHITVLPIVKTLYENDFLYTM